MPGLDPIIDAEIDKLIEAGFIQEDDFPLPIIEIMVDATTGHEVLSFMDGSSGYNQIRMALEDEELTAFRTPKGIYCYKVMPFGLKNVGATYQRAMQKIFNDMLHKNVECYVDDVVVKTKKRSDHLKDLRVVFERLRKYNLKMNPLKCAFGVTSRKFLGFIVKHRGIEVDQSKIKAIQSMPEPRNLHDRTLTGAELNYSPIEKMCLALMFAIQKLRHYMHAYTIHLVAKADPIIYVPAKAVKGQTLADFFADHPIPTDWKISNDLPDEEVFYIDIFLTWMIELCSNNVAEYQTLIIGLQMAINMEIPALEIYGDSKLIINQLLTEYEVRKDDLVPYFRLATQLLQRFEAVTLEHVPRKENQMADVLANLASSMTLEEDEATNPLINYLEHEILPDDLKHRSEARKKPIKLWKKHTQEYVGRISPNQSFISSSKEWVTTGQAW
ncbi:hypothetical protein ACFX2C_022429 [Malus domestica]